MTTYKKFPRTLLAVAVVIAASLCVQNGALAQQARGSGFFEASERIDLLEFPGGTAAEFIEAVRQAFGEVNVVGRGPLDQFAVPAVRLHRVGLSDVMTLLSRIASYADEEPGVMGDLSTNLVEATWVADARVYPVSYARPGRPGQPAPPPPRDVTRVFSIMEILSEFGVDDIITSVETALTLETEANPPEARQFTPEHPRFQAAMRARPAAPDLRLHEETGLLIVRGSPDQVATVESVVDALHYTARTKQTQAQFISREEHERMISLISLMDLEIRELRSQIRALRAERETQEQSE